MFRFSNSPEGGGLGGISEAEPMGSPWRGVWGMSVAVPPRCSAGPHLYSTYKWSQFHT